MAVRRRRRYPFTCQLPIRQSSSRPPPWCPLLRSNTMLLLVTVLLTVLPFASAASQCPRLPDRCLCDASGRNLVITCDGVDANRVIKSIAGLNIERLILANCTTPTLEPIPKCSLRSFAVTGCNVTTISDKVFVQVKDTLEEIDFTDNALKTVPLFGKLPRLVHLNLNGNQISSVPEAVFDGLPRIRHLRLEKNQICELDANSLNDTKRSLELLDLSGNCLSAVPAQSLRNSANLVYLDLSDNKIAEVAKMQFMNLPKLRELRLHDNLLSRIDAMAFMNVPQLQQLKLRNNLLANVDGSRFQAFKELEVLDMSNNLLTKVPLIKDMGKLKQIRLDGNQISRIETLTFSNLPQLQLISVQDNNVELIARNSFDALDKLMILLLANNSIKTIERGMLDGAKNLQQLNMRNNSLTQLDAGVFASIPLVTSIDLADNKIRLIQKGTLDGLPKLFWLDLTNNKLSSFERGTFDKKIANILLYGNPLNCDDTIDWFVSYLVANRVRTFMPFQPEIACATPEKYAGVALKDLMMKKANETLSAPLLNGGMQRSLLTSFIPGLNAMQGRSAADGAMGLAAAPVLSSITQALPALRNLPGMNFPVNGAQGVPQNRDFHSAMEQFTGPLVRFATGGQPVASDIEQLIQSIPNLVVNVPGVGDVDISKLDPNLVAYVLKGGQVPGIPRETLDTVVKQYMQKMAQAAQAAQQGNPLPDQHRYLLPVDKLPADLVTQVIGGQNLPGLDEAQTKSIKDYYTQPMPVKTNEVQAGPAPMPAGGMNNAAMSMMQMLPKGYNISNLPQEVIQAVMRGEIPNMNLLPKDLQQHLQANADKLINTFSKFTANVSLEDLLAKIPSFERPELETFEPYDLNRINHEMHHEETEALKAQQMRLYTAIALGAVGAITVIVLVALYLHMKRHIPDHTSFHPSLSPPRPAVATSGAVLSSTRIHSHQN